MLWPGCSKAKRQIMASEFSAPPLLQSAPFWTLKLADPKLSLIFHISKSSADISRPLFCIVLTIRPLILFLASWLWLISFVWSFGEMRIWSQHRDGYILQAQDTFLQRASEQSSKLRKLCCYVFLSTLKVALSTFQGFCCWPLVVVVIRPKTQISPQKAHAPQRYDHGDGRFWQFSDENENIKGRKTQVQPKFSVNRTI